MFAWWKKKQKEKEEQKIMYVIAGLGNPTAKYEGTRHNIGFDVIDVLAEKYNIKVSDNRHNALCGSGIIEGKKVLLVKPLTFMNASGESIRAILKYYKLSPETDLTIVYDDINLAPGRLRIRKKGSAGGHNGMKSIIACTGTEEFARIRVGVGEKPKGWDLADYVLGRFSLEERKQVEEACEHAAEAAAWIVRGEIDKAMNQYN